MMRMRMRVILVLVLVGVVLGLKPSMKNALKQKAITDFKDAVVPIIAKKVEHLTLPDIKAGHSGVEVHVSNINVFVHQFHPNQINIQLVPGTSSIKFTATEFMMKGLAHIRAKIVIITKSFNADVEIYHLGMTCQITLLSHNGKPNVKLDHLNMHLQSKDVHVHFHGDIIVHILQFVEHLLQGHFISEIVKQLEAKLPPEVTKEVNKHLDTLPSDIPIWGKYNLKYSFPYSPAAKQDYLVTAINAYIHPAGHPNPPPYEPNDFPEYDSGLGKTVQFFMSDYVVRSALDAAMQLKMLYVAMDKDLLGHHIKMVCQATKTPAFHFVNAIDVVADGQCSAELDHDPKKQVIITAQVHVNMNEHMTGAVIFFSITTAAIVKIEFKPLNPVDIEWLKNGINTVLEVLKQIVNADIGQKGIPLPTMHEVDYTDMTQLVKNGYMEIGTTPVFHFKASEDE